MITKIIFISLIFYLINLNYAFSANFKNYLELSACVDEYKSFTGYKNKLNECFKNQGLKLDKDKDFIRVFYTIFLNNTKSLFVLLRNFIN